MTDRFALIAPPEWTASLGGDPLWALCLVDGGLATCSFHAMRGEALMAADGFPVVPTPEGEQPLSLDEDAETEALAVLADAIPDREAGASRPASDGAPAGFAVRSAPTSGGLALRAGDYGLDAMVSVGLAADLGWSAGTRVQVAFDPAATRLALFPSDAGSRLEDAVTEGGLPVLELERTLAGLPSWLLEVAPEAWCTVPFELCDGHVVVDLPDFLRQSERGAEVVGEPVAVRGTGVRRGTIRFLVGLALGAMGFMAVDAIVEAIPGDIVIGESVMPTPPSPPSPEPIDPL